MSETRTARKAHRCIHCERTIRPGERYMYARLTPWDHPDNDHFFDYRAHMRCDEFWRVEACYDDEGRFLGEPREYRRECWRWHVRQHRKSLVTA